VLADLNIGVSLDRFCESSTSNANLLSLMAIEGIYRTGRLDFIVLLSPQGKSLWSIPYFWPTLPFYCLTFSEAARRRSCLRYGVTGIAVSPSGIPGSALLEFENWYRTDGCRQSGQQYVYLTSAEADAEDVAPLSVISIQEIEPPAKVDNSSIKIYPSETYLRILLVDDIAAHAEIISAVIGELSKPPYCLPCDCTNVVSNILKGGGDPRKKLYSAALKEIESGEYDVLLTDLELNQIVPRHSGHELITFAKHKHPKKKVFVVSEVTKQHEFSRLLESKADGVISKYIQKMAGGGPIINNDIFRNMLYFHLKGAHQCLI
jgi:CheY-like chemotaxis protein